MLPSLPLVPSYTYFTVIYDLVPQVGDDNDEKRKRRGVLFLDW